MHALLQPALTVDMLTWLASLVCQQDMADQQCWCAGEQAHHRAEHIPAGSDVWPGGIWGPPVWCP